jgi:6-phosphofructokinase 1
VKSEVQRRLESRNIKVTLVDKAIGYASRCAPPIPFDVEYAHDLGYAAVQYLLNGGSGAMITSQVAKLRRFHLPKWRFVDRLWALRPVDVGAESYQVARDYMVRLGPKDLRDEAWIAKLAQEGGLSSEEFVSRFGKSCRRSRTRCPITRHRL